MPLKPDDALKTVANILSGPRTAEATRLNLIAAAMASNCGPVFTTNVEIPADAPEVVKRLAYKSTTNFLPLLVDTFSQVMKVDGYFQKGSAEDATPWQWWQRNRMGARQTGIHRSALQYGVAYATVLPGDKGPVIAGHSPRKMTALYQDPSSDEWPMLALLVDGAQMRLYDETNVYLFGIENPGLRGALAMPAATMDYTGQGTTTYDSSAAPVPITGSYLSYIETRAHDVGVCPVVRYRDRMLLDGEEQYGIVEPLITIQNRINETTFGMLVTQFFQAFKQRYVLGWVPESEAEYLRATQADTWTFESSDVTVGQLEPASMAPYIDAKTSAIRDFASIGQIPAQNLGVDAISNISDATLAGLEVGKERKTDEITTSLGESHEQTLRLSAYIDGDETGADDYTGEVRWKDKTARAYAATVDGLGKLGQMLGVPQELLWEDIPGWNQTKVDRAKELALEGNAFGNLTNMLAQQAEPTPPAA